MFTDFFRMLQTLQGNPLDHFAKCDKCDTNVTQLNDIVCSWKVLTFYSHPIIRFDTFGYRQKDLFGGPFVFLEFFKKMVDFSLTI